MYDTLTADSSYQNDLQRIVRWMEKADAIVIGGASGMSTACGYEYYTHHTPFFEDYFSDFGKIYHEPSCWQLLYHRYSSDEERWAYMARSGCVMLDLPAGETYRNLYALMQGKDYYIITTNQDAQFSKVFDPERIFTVQGDAHWMQCAHRCHDRIYPSEETPHRLNANIVDGKLRTEDVPRCPVCGGVMEPWVKSFIFHYCGYWEEQAAKYEQYLKGHVHQKVLFLGLGIGRMTPEFIKNPFMQMTLSWPDAKLVLLNKGEPEPPAVIADKTIAMDTDLAQVLQDLVTVKQTLRIWFRRCQRRKLAEWSRQNLYPVVPGVEALCSCTTQFLTVLSPTGTVRNAIGVF